MTRPLAKWGFSRAAALLAGLAATAPAHSLPCPTGTVFNPITKVRWNCIFPITIGGVRIGSFDKLSKELGAQSSSKPLCACRKGATFWFGVKVSFWSPNHMVDVVTEPGRIGRDWRDRRETPVGKISQARTEAKSQHGAQGKDMIGCPARVGIMLGDPKLGAVAGQTVEHIGASCVAAEITLTWQARADRP